MKTYKLILSALALVAVLSVNAFAQSADVPVTANVLSAISISKTQDVRFGDVALNSASYLKASAEDGAPEANVGLGSSEKGAGEVSITGDDGSSISVTFGTATLSDGSGTNPTISFTPTVYFGATQISSGDSITLTTGPDLINIGGSLASIGVAGAYSTGNSGGSNLTVTVEYN